MEQDTNTMLAVFEGLILSEVHRSIRRYGGSVNDLSQEAYLAAIRAIQSYDARRGSLKKRVRYAVRYALLNLHRRNAQRRTVALPNTLVAPVTHTFNVQDFMHELSDDAKAVLSLIVDSDPAFWGYRTTRIRWIQFLHTHLRRMDWSTPRITEAFSCIRNALA